MANIRAFKGIRPLRSKVHLVAARPFYSYKKSVLKAKLEDNPYTFLHIINPEFGTKSTTKPNSKARFQKVREKFEHFLKQGIFITDTSPHLYIYNQSKEGMSVRGIFAGISVDDYTNDIIKKHEQTLTAREDLFTNYLDIVGFNAEPVLLTYQSNSEIQEILNSQMAQRPEYDFTTTDGITHQLWLLNEVDSQIICQLFKQVPSLYIADGHHRSASSVRYAQKLREGNQKYCNAADYFLGYLVCETEVHIAAYHRLLKSKNGISHADFIAKLEKHGKVEKLKDPSLPQSKHEIHIYFDQTWLKYRAKYIELDDPDPIKNLDAQVLSEHILRPIFGIADLKTSDQIEFLAGGQSLEKIIEIVDSKKSEIAFLLYPASIEEIKKVADAGLNMPPKSTWIEPKLRSGLTIYSLEHD